MHLRIAFLALALVLAVPTLLVAGENPAPPLPEPAAGAFSPEKAARLDALFAALQSAPTPAEGKQAEQLILLEWLSSGDDSVDTLMAGALTAMRMRAFPAAIDILDKVVVAKPDYVEGWNKRATVYYYMRQYDRSLSDIQQTLALDPRHFGALAGLGMIMQDIGNTQAAIAAFEKAVAINPTLDNIRVVINALKARTGKDI